MDEKVYKESQERYLLAEKLIDEVVEMYYKDSCACSHATFVQLAGIDCVDYQQAFVCWETELIIGRVQDHYSIKELEAK